MYDRKFVHRNVFETVPITGKITLTYVLIATSSSLVVANALSSFLFSFSSFCFSFSILTLSCSHPSLSSVFSLTRLCRRSLWATFSFWSSVLTAASSSLKFLLVSRRNDISRTEGCPKLISSHHSITYSPLLTSN